MAAKKLYRRKADRPRRVVVLLPPGLHETVTAAAAKERTSRSRYILDAIRERVA